MLVWCLREKVQSYSTFRVCDCRRSVRAQVFDLHLLRWTERATSNMKTSTTLLTITVPYEEAQNACRAKVEPNEHVVLHPTNALLHCSIREVSNL